LKRDAVGAEIRVTAGARTRVAIVQPCSSYLSSHDPRCHFGLGELARYEQIEVRWPDGLTEVFPAGAADVALVLERGSGQSTTPDVPAKRLQAGGGGGR
jgi:hypothetical protein